jgi:hypothetical protein
MAKKSAAKTKPTLPKGDVVLIHSGIHYVRNGDVTVNLTLVFAKPALRADVTRTFPQPKKWVTDDAIVTAVHALYPTATAVWADDYAQ